MLAQKGNASFRSPLKKRRYLPTPGIKVASSTKPAVTRSRAQAQCAYAHVAIVSPYAAPDAPELGWGGSRVTVLLCGDAHDLPDGLLAVPVSPDTLRGGGLNLVL